MMFAIKLSKGQCDGSLCPYMDDELSQKLAHSRKVQQQTLKLGRLTVGGENFIYINDKTFINPCVYAITLDS